MNSGIAVIPPENNIENRQVVGTPPAWVFFLGAGLGYFAAVRLGVELTAQSANVAMVWPASGVALAAVLLAKPRQRPAMLSLIFLLNLLGNLLYGTALAVSLGFAAANALEAIVAGWLIRRFVGERFNVLRPQNILALICAATFGNAFTSLLGALVPSLAFGTEYVTAYKTWIMSDGLGILLVTPLLMAWLTHPNGFSVVTRVRLTEAFLIVAIGLLYLWTYYGPNASQVHDPFGDYLIFPLILWVAFRFSPRGVTAYLAFFAVSAITATLLGHGLFAGFSGGMENRLFSLQMYVGIITLSGITLSAIVTERSRNQSRDRAILQSAMDGFWVCDLSSRLLEVNDAYCQIVGYSRAELLGMRIQDLEANETPEETEAHIREVIQTGSDRFESLHRCKDGRVIVVEVSVHYIPMDGGQLFVFTRDITAARKFQQTLQENEARYRDLANSIEDVFFAMDARMRLTFWNRACVDLTGIAEANALGKTFEELFPQYKDSIFERLSREALEHRRFVSFINEYKKPDGQIVTLQVNAYPSATGISVLAQDITQQKQAEIALRESENKYRNLVETAQELVWKCDREGRFTYLNPAWENTFGYKVEEMIGHLFGDFQRPEAFERDRQELGRIVAGGSVKGYETTYIAQSGRELTLLFNSLPLFGENGLVVGVQGTATDITARKLAEERLRESEASLKDSQQVAHVGHWKWDTQTNIVSWSDEMYRIFGIDPEGFTGDLTEIIARAIHPDDRQKVNASNEAVLKEQHPAPLEYRVLWPDGRVRTVWAVPSGRVTDEQGNILKLTGIVQDITERKQAEEKYRAVVDNIEGVVWEADAVTFQFTFVSDRVEKLFGYPKERWLNEKNFWADHIHPEDRDAAVDYCVQQTQRMAPHEFEYRLITADEKIIWVRDIVNVVVENNRPIKLHGIMVDITESKKIEQALHESERQYRLLFDEMMSGFALHEVICDEHGRPSNYRFLAVNQMFEKMTGKRSEDIIGKTVLDVFPNTEAYWIETYGRVALTGEPTHFQNYSQAMNRHYDVRAYCPEHGKFASIFHDITEQKQIEIIENARIKLIESSEYGTVDEILQMALDEAEFLTGSRIGFFHFLDEDQTNISLQNWSTRTKKEFCTAEGKGRHYPVEQAGVWADCIRQRRPVIHNDYENLPHRKGLPSGHAAVTRELIVPILRGDHILGILGVGNKIQPYTDGDVDLVSRLASLSWDIVERKRSSLSLAARTKELETLFSISSHLRTAQSVQEMLPKILEQMGALFHTDSNEVILYNANTDRFVFEVGTGAFKKDEGVDFPPDNSISGMIMESLQPYTTLDFGADPQRAPAVRDVTELGPAILVPIQSETEFLGVLLSARKKDSLFGPYTPDELQLLKAIGEMVGNALRRARLYDQAITRLRQVQSLRSIDLAITANMDWHVTLNILVTEALALLRVDAISIRLLNPTSLTLEHAISKGFHNESTQPKQVRLGERLTGRAAFERKLVAAPNLPAEAERSEQETIRQESFASGFFVPMIAKGQMRGVLEIYSRKTLLPQQEWLELLEALAAQAALTIDNAQLFNQLQQSNFELSMAYDATIEGWSMALDLRDHETEGHTRRVTDWTVRLARAAGIGESEIVHMRRGALLHDIGKMGVPDKILNKPGPLTDKERDVIEEHPRLAFELLHPIEFLRPAIEIPYSHHEKWDGSGYPRNLHGHAIPYAARLFAIVDVWDALTSDRSYRKAWSQEQAFDYILQQKGKHFDPQLVDLFMEEIRRTAFEVSRPNEM